MRSTTVLRPIAIKELRETVGITALGMLAAFYVVTSEMQGVFPWSVRQDLAIPFLFGEHAWFVDPTYETLTWVAVALAVALGLKQTAWESHNGTYLFLLHRPVEWQWIMATKVVIGILAYGIALSVPVLVYAIWAATPGTHASPFYWSMTISAWQGVLTGMLLYLGSFLSGLVPGHWYGSKLMPLVTSAAIAFALLQVNSAWPLVSFAVLLLTAILFWQAILLVGIKREYA